MAEDIWQTVTVPLLERLYKVEQDTPLGSVSVGDLADAMRLAPNAVASQLDALVTAGYVGGNFHKPLTGGDFRPWFLVSPHLLERGLRTVRAWPSDDPYEALLDLLDRRISSAEEPERQSRLRALRAALVDIGKATASGLLVEVARGTIH